MDLIRVGMIVGPHDGAQEGFQPRGLAAKERLACVRQALIKMVATYIINKQYILCMINNDQVMIILII